MEDHVLSTQPQPWWTAWRRLVIGVPIPTTGALHHRLPIYLALPVFASDAVSSVAYSTQEILMVLAGVTMASGASALRWQFGISLAIAILVLIIATSYYRAVLLYPTSGGSYTVTKSNLGPMLGLVAGAALLIDYIMTVAVSISSGVDAMVSVYPNLSSTRVAIAVVLVALLALANLRGVKESGWLFAFPLYCFISLLIGVIFVTITRYILAGGHIMPMGTAASLPAHLRLPESLILPKAGATLGLFLVLRAFANGCSAMTGTEAVSNGVSAFEPPEAKHAAQTLVMLALIIIILTLGIGFAAHMYHVIPSAHETVLSMVTRATFGYTLPYYATQFATLAILIVAANTSYADFPRLLAFMAHDQFAPKAFTRLGDRLVYSRGIIALSIISVLIIMAYQANVTALIGLYSIGVFLCFTLSQLGMAKKIGAMRSQGWRGGVALNLFGACITGMVAVVVALSKFAEGAWIVLVLIPLIMLMCYQIQRHYAWFDETMSLHPQDYNPLCETAEQLSVLVLVSSDIHRGILEGLACGRGLVHGKPGALLRAVHIAVDPRKTARLQAKWARLVTPFLGDAMPLQLIHSTDYRLTDPLLHYLDQLSLERPLDRIVVVLPEFHTGNWLAQRLHNATAHRLRRVLLNRPHITVVTSRFFMKPS